MRFVPVKSAEQQALLTLHRVRQGFIEDRTGTMSRIRGLLAEFGVALPLRADTVRRKALIAAEGFPALARRAIEDLCSHLRELDAKVLAYDREIELQARECEPARRLMKIRGVGPLSALASVANRRQRT
jgi:transposase